MTFFEDKINKMHEDLMESSPFHQTCIPDVALSSCKLEKFDVVAPEELLLVSSQIAKKSCLLDPLTAKLLQKLLHVLNPVVLAIVYTSLQTGFVPSSLKEAILKPVLKNFKLVHCESMNFRLISNLAFLSKVVEKVVSKQIIQYIDLNKRYQSAYRAFHSTETALLKVHNDIAWSIDAE